MSDKKRGERYAEDQIESDYFMQWVREQIAEAAQMDPSKVLPLETKRDAKKIARNMLQQLEWDVERDMDENRDFFKGFTEYTNRPEVVDWLADELLEMQRQIEGEEHHLREPREARGVRRPQEAPLPSQRIPLPTSKDTPIRAIPKYDFGDPNANYAIEVIGGTGKRGWRFWLGYFATEEDAVAMTEHLIQSGRHQAVRVVGIREKWKPVWEWPERTRWSSLWREGAREAPRKRGSLPSRHEAGRKLTQIHDYVKELARSRGISRQDAVLRMITQPEIHAKALGVSPAFVKLWAERDREESRKLGTWEAPKRSRRRRR